jgi:hypothetical protein
MPRHLALAAVREVHKRSRVLKAAGVRDPHLRRWPQRRPQRPAEIGVPADGERRNVIDGRR